MKIKRLLPFAVIFSLLFSFVSYAYTALDDKTVKVPDDDTLYTTIAEINKDLLSMESRYMWIPNAQQLNTLVYHMENNPETITDKPYVTVLTYATGIGISCTGQLSRRQNYPVIYLSDSPMILGDYSTSTVGIIGGSFASGSVYVLRPIVSGSQVVWRLDVNEGGKQITLADDIRGNVIDYYDLKFANYDIDSYKLTTKYASITKQLSGKYKKYTNSLHSGMGRPIGEKDKDIPIPKNLKGFFDMKDDSDGVIRLTWTPEDGYSCRIVGYAEMIATPLIGDSYTFYSTKVFHAAERDVNTPYPSERGVFTCNLSNFVFGVGENEPDYPRKSFRPTRFTVQFYKHVDGVLKVGGVASVRFNVDDGTIFTEEEDVDGNVTVGDKYDENGNVIIGGGGSSGSSFQDIINDLMNIPSIFTGFFASLKGLFSELSVMPELMASLFGFLPESLIAIIGIGIAVVVVLRILGR